VALDLYQVTLVASVRDEQGAVIMRATVATDAKAVVVCNIRGRGENGNKNDRLDADRLSELLRRGSLKAVYHGASALLH
jgi:hypothetical protein